MHVPLIKAQHNPVWFEAIVMKQSSGSVAARQLPDVRQLTSVALVARAMLALHTQVQRTDT